MSATSSDWLTHPWVHEGDGRVRFGIHLGPYPSWAVTIEWVQLVEELGFDSFWLRDHPGRAPEDTWTYLAALAVSTKRLRLGTLVNCVYYRSPTVLARSAADVDRLSNGRLVLGVGAGYDPGEFEQLGIPLPSTAERLEALEETIQIVGGLWGPTPFTFAGRHFQVSKGQFVGGPIQTPRVPLLIGGGGEKVTLRLAAQYADMANIDGVTLRTGDDGLADVRRKSLALSRHCADRGRTHASMIRSYHAATIVADSRDALNDKLNADPWPPRFTQFPISMVGTPDEVIGQFRTLVDAGINYFNLNVRDEETLRLLAREVVPAFDCYKEQPMKILDTGSPSQIAMLTRSIDLADIIRAQATAQPDGVAMVFEERETTYQELDRTASRVANGLRALNPSPGTRIAQLDKNSDHYYELLFGPRCEP